MKKAVVFLFILISSVNQAQSWQWGKRGGALDPIQGRQEETYSLVTDGNKNIYGLSRVGFVGLDIDEVEKEAFDWTSFPVDYALFSFGCDGSYRWSKIIGGINVERIHPLQVDTQNNVYLAGRFGSCTDEFYPARIDDDFINNEFEQDCRLFFLAKYDDEGVMQWIRRPQSQGVDPSISYTQTRTAGMQIDSSGIINWLLLLPPGTYADGAFVNTQQGSNWFILRYNSDGTYLGNIPIDIQTTGGFDAINFQINHYNGQFYLYGTKFSSISGVSTIGGHPLTKSTFLTSFDALGNYLWHHEDTFVNPGSLSLYNLDFDAQNNIYMGGRMSGTIGPSGNFLGFSISAPITPGFVMKTNPDATQLLWGSHSNVPTEIYGGIVLNGNELGFTSYCGLPNFTWGDQVLNVNNMGDGQEVLLARFNKDTGACIALTNIPGNAGFNDVGTAITADASGDYILGGSIGGTLFFDNNQQITNTGSQSDFFVAKYATQVCSPLDISNYKKENVVLYPNPAGETITLTVKETVSYAVYNLLGILVQEGYLTEDNQTITVVNLPTGHYIVQLTKESGAQERLQFIKR